MRIAIQESIIKDAMTTEQELAISKVAALLALGNEIIVKVDGVEYKIAFVPKTFNDSVS